RGRANALRLALAGEAEEREARSAERAFWPFALGARRSALRAKWVHDVLDLCLMCKACKAECPSNVDMAKLKAEFLESHYAGRLRPLGHVMMAHIHFFNRLGARAAWLVNWLQRRRTLRWLMEKLAGIDRRRSLPRLHRKHFRRWFARHTPASNAGRYGRVVLL